MLELQNRIVKCFLARIKMLDYLKNIVIGNKRAMLMGMCSEYIIILAITFTSRPDCKCRIEHKWT